MRFILANKGTVATLTFLTACLVTALTFAPAGEIWERWWTFCIGIGVECVATDLLRQWRNR